MAEAATRLRAALARNQALAERLLNGSVNLERLLQLQEWQQKRLSRTHEVVLQQEDAQAAGHFFLTQLYGGLDFIERDRDVARVAPLLIRFLPESALATLAEAFELQALSLELDLAMVAEMERRDLSAVDEMSYAEVYRASDQPQQRERQVALILQLGGDLKRLVRKRLLLRLVRVMRGPARTAGYGNLHDFLEDGLGAFRALNDTDAFVAGIFERESVVRQRMLDGSEDPYLFAEGTTEVLGEVTSDL